MLYRVRESPPAPKLERNNPGLCVLMRAQLLRVMPDSLRPHGLHSRWNSPDQNTRVGSHSLLQGILRTQESNLCLLHWQADSLPLSRRGSPTVRVLPQNTHCTPTTGSEASVNTNGPVPRGAHSLTAAPQTPLPPQPQFKKTARWNHQVYRSSSHPRPLLPRSDAVLLVCVCPGPTCP